MEGECEWQKWLKAAFLPSTLRTRLAPFLSTLTNAQTLWSDLSVFAGRDSASIKTRAFCGDETLLVAVASC